MINIHFFKKKLKIDFFLNINNKIYDNIIRIFIAYRKMKTLKK